MALLDKVADATQNPIPKGDSNQEIRGMQIVYIVMASVVIVLAILKHIFPSDYIVAKWHKSAKSAKPGKPGKPEDEEEEVPVETYRKRIKDLDKKLADKEHAHQAALKDHQAALKDQQLSHQKLLDSYEKLRGDYTQLVANHLKHSEKLTEQHILNNQKLTEQHFLNNQKLIDLLVNEKRRAEHACFKARTEREAAVARAEKAEERIRHLERQIEKQNESESVEKIGERS